MMAGLQGRLLRWAAGGLYHAGLIRPLSLALGCAGRTPSFQVLTYHRVNDDDDPFFPAVSTGVFERQMAYIAATYRVMTVEDLADRMVRGALPRNALAITLDDGYRDNLTHAAPILEKHGLPATVFLATGAIGTGEILWFDKLAMAFKRTQASAFAAPWGVTVPLRGPIERLRALETTLRYLKRLSDDDLRRTADSLVKSLILHEASSPEPLMLAWEEVRALIRLGFSIGAHTMTHPILSRVDPKRAWAEILSSRTMIESACGRAPRAFAYPSGRSEDYTEAVTHLVREAGFACAVTTRFGINTRETAPYELCRGGPWEEHLPTYALKLAWYRAPWAAERGGPGQNVE
jgi:peptidoglycan/xylan/chitin deacetylase (PgdA/CDA1 family)